jgi:signal transduction histidine kinase/CheY-like chemotaxis protein
MSESQSAQLSLFCRLQINLAQFSNSLHPSNWTTESALRPRVGPPIVSPDAGINEAQSPLAIEPLRPFGLLLSPQFSLLILPGVLRQDLLEPQGLGARETGPELWFESDRILTFLAELRQRYRNYSRIHKLQGYAASLPFHNETLAQQQFSQLLTQTYEDHYAALAQSAASDRPNANSPNSNSPLYSPQWTATRLQADPEPIVETLSERPNARQTQDLAEALMAAQAADQVKGEFLATMSHELRTPLTCVIGMSATLLRWSFGPLTTRQREYLQLIHDSGEHLLVLINDILELSQVEAGQSQLAIADFSLTRTAQHCIELFQDQARAAKISLHSSIHLNRNQDLFSADLRRVRQILINLLDNALKFTNPPGTVILRVWREDTWAVFQVEDTGIGFDEAQKEQLFQRFRQLEGRHHRAHSGLGVGLTLTKRFIDLHQGRIEIDSAPNQGSIFTVWLPGQVVAPPVPAKPSPRPQIRGQIVLLEDEDETAMLICELLTAAGFQVVWLIEGSTALEQVQHLQPIAVILDLGLADSSALELLGHLRQVNRTTKVVALVPQLQHPPIDEGGIDAILPKPIQPDQLLTTLSLLLAIDQPLVPCLTTPLAPQNPTLDAFHS